MKSAHRKSLLLIFGLFLADLVHAQSQAIQGQSWLIYLLLAVAILLFFVIVIQVSDNLLAIEAKRSGITEKAGAFSIFPSSKELLPSRKPNYATDERVIHSSKGFNILLEGNIENGQVNQAKVNTYAIKPQNFIGISPIPKVTVEVGDTVKAGDIIFFDKKNPEVKYAAPVSGEIIEINRGAKRSIAEVVILAEKKMSYRTYDTPDLATVSREDLVQFLLGSGVWPMLRQRPYNVIPDPLIVPRDVFISTFDSGPLSPDNGIVVAGREAAFQAGLDVLNKLTSGSVYLGLDARSQTDAPHTAFSGAQGVEKIFFSGKHPIGNVGVQIHNTRPVSGSEVVWTPDVQAVITLGALFSEKKFKADRIVAVVGSEIKTPQYLHTFQGARISELTDGNVASENVRYISGDVLAGKQVASDSFLNFYDDQLTVIEEGDYYEMFGWLIPIAPRPSISGTFPNFLFPGLKFKGDTNTHGERRAFVKTGDYERVLPMDIYPQQLMKSILVNDIERMEGLGIHELVEEDIALCEFVCVSKQPLQQILREGLDRMREEG